MIRLSFETDRKRAPSREKRDKEAAIVYVLDKPINGISMLIQIQYGAAPLSSHTSKSIGDFAAMDPQVVLRGLKNGLHYGVKIRLPHAAVSASPNIETPAGPLSRSSPHHAPLTFCRLFSLPVLPGPCSDQVMTLLVGQTGLSVQTLEKVAKLTWTHGKNLALFVGGYKLLLEVRLPANDDIIVHVSCLPSPSL